MKTSLAWLNDYLDRKIDADEAERLLTRVGFPLDGRDLVNLTSGNQDEQLDVEITSNRSDCLSHVGLAREVAAASGAGMKRPAIEIAEDASLAVSERTQVANEQPTLCPLYTARVIEGVKVGPSPKWLVDRLEAVGLRSVNNVVDVTNYVLLELGQPLHAFDMSKLTEGRIVVRRASKGEGFTAIDGSKHELRDDMLVIADAKRPIAVAGVMGGQDSEVSEGTTNVLLESAIFAPLSVRRTSRRLKLASDSSYRFERGVDPLGVERASQRAAQLIVMLAGGRLAQGVIRAGQSDPAAVQVTMRVERCNALLGTAMSAQQQAGYLDRLELSPRIDAGKIICTVPTFRLDLKREVDLVEEVGRSHGFDAIDRQERISIEARPRQSSVEARRRLSQALVAHGFHETITLSFVGKAEGQPFVPAGSSPVLVNDDLRKAEPMLRPSLLPSLLICRKANQDAGNADVRLFESAAAWHEVNGEMIEQRQLALLADAGDAQQAVRDLRGTIEDAVEQLGGQAARAGLSFEPVERETYAAAATVRLHGEAIGVMGLLADGARDVFDVKTPVVAAELLAEPMLKLYPPTRQVQALPRHPAIERDLSVLVSEDVLWREIEQAVREAQPALLESVRFIGTYRGKPIAAGQKSVSFRMVFRDPGKTLRHDEVDPQVETVVAALKDAVSAALRV
ncbi:phenylalanine--tRNA ligase subunit beta [Phycisphaerales bacterium AB-hyl4]|uniref:Phenylalanine--tRNA ligase beta subunit n=1 Tax=Natronomicrosphaera hydrolytica TaxID=3242702 RepID=A0ABV4TZN1_9BACT